MKRPSVGTAVRVVVSLLLVGYLIAGVEWAGVGQLAARAHPAWLLASFAMSPLLALVSAWKWALLLRAQRRPLPLSRLFHLYLVGYFFNNVLPSNVGGDVVRAYQAGRELDDQPVALASVFVERFTGLTVLIALAAGALFTRSDLFADRRFVMALSVVLLAYAAVVAVVWVLRPGPKLERRIPTRLGKRVLGQAIRLHEAIRSYSDHRAALAGALALSFLFYALAVVNVHVSSLAFGAHLSPATLVAIVPVILVIAMMPISLGGIGLQEWAYVYTFASVGAGGPAGLLVALLMRVKSVSYGLIGGMLYARGGRGGETAGPAAGEPAPRS